MKKSTFIAVVLILSFVVVSLANEPVNLKIVGQIKSECITTSQVEKTLFYLTDFHGPRLTNSPNYMAAAQWCVDKLTEWVLENATLEPWGTFGRGWAVEKFSIEMLEPQYVNLIAQPKAWTPGTKGVITGKPVLVKIQTEADIEKYKGKLSGAMVMTQAARVAEMHFDADTRRYSEENLSELMQAPEPHSRPSWFA